jgi:glycerol-3-phosphate dehydrogenase (NAD(P)+)
LGDNARAAVITRGLAEIARLTEAMGGRRETCMGLAGLGDVTLTCTAMQSRNFSLGHALGQGRSLGDILSERRSVAEGVATAEALALVARRFDVDMPLADAVRRIVHGGESVDAVIESLLSRPMPETEA